MTKDDIIRMAKEAEMPMAWITEAGVYNWQDLEKFANLVAAAEREAIAKFMLSVDLSGLKNDPALQHYTENLLLHNAKAIRAMGQE